MNNFGHIDPAAVAALRNAIATHLSDGHGQRKLSLVVDDVGELISKHRDRGVEWLSLSACFNAELLKADRMPVSAASLRKIFSRWRIRQRGPPKTAPSNTAATLSDLEAALPRQVHAKVPGIQNKPPVSRSVERRRALAKIKSTS